MNRPSTTSLIVLNLLTWFTVILMAMSCLHTNAKSHPPDDAANTIRTANH